jgi:uncharacterized protein
METANRIPSFPLNLVLFPTVTIPVHIFEPQYKILIQHCISRPIEFGIVLAFEQAIATAGCTADIIEKGKEYPDGEMDILVKGRSMKRSPNTSKTGLLR